ncbi:hypothetical protein BCR34DRAFT_62348 [Clohesyomyces aquaticus]|uniref:C2H2-type domain-containing protein n=1 Tax=Clohesyomyces aquaticus TaxID=1231657 RepID=A0A1Y2A3R1_9PLEO|nr:hypothetical protein BCR34DRAFT_62348 [Clohesyomyces aquaticus]
MNPVLEAVPWMGPTGPPSGPATFQQYLQLDSNQVVPKPEVFPYLEPYSSHASHGEPVERTQDRHRAILPKKNPELLTTTSSQSVSKALRCSHAGCKYKGTFKRAYELKRHMKLHTQPRKYPCPVLNCEYTTSRDDKFQAHIKKGHHEDELTEPPHSLWGCPESLPLGLVKFSARNTLKREALPVLEILSKLPYDERLCPVHKCNDCVKLSEMQKHLQSHSTMERRESLEAIRHGGYDAFNFNIICPICHQHSANHEAFQHHFISSHTILGTGSKIYLLDLVRWHVRFPGKSEPVAEFWSPGTGRSSARTTDLLALAIACTLPRPSESVNHCSLTS